MLNLSFEFRKGIFFIRLIGDLNRITSKDKEAEITNLINKNRFKYVVINTNYLDNIDIYGINFIKNLIYTSNSNLIICDKFKIISRLINNIPNISSELEVL